MNRNETNGSIEQIVIRRPGRYVGREWNLPETPSKALLRCVLCYPDVYEIGMSHSGLQVLYHILRNIPDIAVERVFAPWPDKEKALRSDNCGLLSLETKRPVRNADIICFTIPHELSFTNILNVLDLSGLPLRSQKRNDSMPFILGGGIATMNPLPIESFFDGFFIGEAEERLPELVHLLKNTPRKNWPTALTAIPGVYIPELFKSKRSSQKVVKQFVRNLDSVPVPDPPLTPWCKPIHERVVVEVARGCPGQCRFCQAQKYYHPVRQRSSQTIVNTVTKNLQQTGYEEVSLLSLNIADYPGIEDLLFTLMSQFNAQNVSVSLPSLRPEKLGPKIIDQIRRVRKTGFTLAPEAGSDRLRKIIGKPFESQKLLDSVEKVFMAGWQVIKLYFMIGLPFETDRDVQSICCLVRDIYRIGRRIAGKRAALHVSIGVFIPKAHTPFQWFGQASEETLARRRKILVDGCRIPGIKLSLPDFATSRLEACFARGGSNYSDIIEYAFLSGCRMDAWNELFRKDIWNTAFMRFGLNPDDEAIREFLPEKDCLPWSFIDSGIPEIQLRNQYYKTCSIGSRKSSEDDLPKIENTNTPFKNISYNKLPNRVSPGTVYTYVGVSQVLGDFRLFSHMELMTGVMRAMRRARLPLVYSQGFNPHPKISWMQPVPLGFEKWSDPLVFQLSQEIPDSDVLDILNAQLPGELSFHTVTRTNLAKPLQQYDRAVIALKSGKRNKSLVKYVEMTDMIKSIEIKNSRSILSGRLMKHHLDFVCTMPTETTLGPTLKTLMEFCFDEKPVPLDNVYGVRVGWLNAAEDISAVLGMEKTM